ncbi:MAG: VWA domain-containing protein [Clostridia bacterium]|nr:VWA domain-containing protein [Clostridia bacterium]
MKTYKNRRYYTIPLLLLALCLLMGCTVKPGDLPIYNDGSEVVAGEDGEIKGSGNGDMAVDSDMVLDAESADRADDSVWDTPMEEAPMAPDDMPSWKADEESAPGDGYYGGSGTNGFSQQAGQLTASEWKDLESWDDFKALVNQNNFYSIAEKWSIYATSRIKVNVLCDNVPVKGAKVELLDENGTLLWGAVSDYKGAAYLFYNVTDAKGGQVPHSVRVTAVNGVTATAQVEAGTEEITVTPAGAANPALTLDLMLMVDTTGSMGDELEYLKAELGDVITRAAKDSNVTVRTSVNFYRDTTDEYIVRYYDFRDSVDEAVALLAQQSANGGGDYPEAVHTAMENAITGHAWSESSVKLLFFVFDAPPHAEQEVMQSLQQSIKAAAETGIRVIPVASSGVDDTCQLLFRSYAALTGGTYTYLTNHSGIGGSHATPELPEEPGVERLNDMMVRIITEYCQ